MAETPTFDEARSRIDHALAERPPRVLSLPGFTHASILIPLLNRPAGPTILFTRRSETVQDHKGQISFPGGRREEGENAVEAALREAHEEVGLPPSSVEIAGRLDDQASVSWYVVTPVVGLVGQPPASHTPQASEVLDSFEVPLQALLDPSSLRHEWWDASRMPPGSPTETLLGLKGNPARKEYKVYFFDAAPAGNGPIWGLTARILKDLLARAFGFTADDPSNFR